MLSQVVAESELHVNVTLGASESAIDAALNTETTADGR
mgnify:CR=1 FL=1